MTELAGKRIVIAGGIGFLGLSMVEHFKKQNASVTVSIPGAPVCVKKSDRR